jgi:hypothetical protein
VDSGVERRKCGILWAGMMERYGCGAVGGREKRLDFLGMRAYNRRASEFLNRPV